MKGCVAMKKRLIFISLILVIFSMVLYGCGANNTDNANNEDFDEIIREKDEKIIELQERIDELEEGATSDNLIIRTIEVMGLLKDKNMDELANYVHPTKGVRFSPYPYVDVENDQVFTPDELSNALESNEVYNWGNYDGSGEPINLTFEDYYDRFIYDVDFANPELIGNNTIIGEGNAIENVEEAYPNSRFIEFYFSGFNSEYGGADWRSLKLVFEENEGSWYLVGIIHGEWTI